MQHHFCFEAVDQMLQDIWSNDCLFSGLPMVIGGDFAQILPVVCQGTRATILRACIQHSYIWPRLFLLFCGKICNSSTIKTVKNLELGYKNCLIIRNDVIALARLFFYNRQAKWMISTIWYFY